MGDGKVFDGWYAGDTKLTGQAAAGTTYTAHWTDSQYKVPDTLALEGYVYGGAPVAGNTEVAAPAEEAMLLSLSPAANTLRRWQMA